MRKTFLSFCKDSFGFMYFSKYLFAVSLLLVTGCKKVGLHDDLAEPVNENTVSKVSAARSTTTTGPNIILILADDVGYEIPTSNGGQSYQTPKIDQMASEGLRFTQCHAAPLCTPSRVMLLTGKYNFRNYIRWAFLNPTEKTFANMMHDAGYRTLVTGKWQLDGGDVSMRGFGFDDYLVWAPFSPDGTGEGGKGSRYKNPTLYRNAAYLPSAQTNNKYGEDLFTDAVKDFIDESNTLGQPFFIYYPMCLGHFPFCPTPDDPEFNHWDPKQDESDTRFFPSMMKYMDKKVGEIINKVKNSPVANNTLIIFMGDNGTNKDITSQYNGTSYKGGKSTPTEAGTWVPMIAWWQGVIAPGVNDDLIDLTDFMPSLASIAGINVPAEYGIIDGVNFHPRLLSQPGTPRDWIFCHFNPQQMVGQIQLTRWAQNKKFRLFDSTGGYYLPQDNYYDVVIDPRNKKPLKAPYTQNQQSNKTELRSVLESMHN